MRIRWGIWIINWKMEYSINLVYELLLVGFFKRFFFGIGYKLFLSWNIWYRGRYYFNKVKKKWFIKFWKEKKRIIIVFSFFVF